MKIPLSTLCALALTGALSTAADFQNLGTYRGLGAVVATAVGPGQAAGSERFYASYLYVEHTIDVVGIDAATGKFQVFANPAPGESGARCMVKGPDGNLYLGTLPTAHFLKLDTKAGKLIDLGRPSATEQYIWDVAFGADNKLYGATYPQSKLVRYDPATGKLEDLGRMDPVEQYAHYVAGSADGFMYIGIGTSRGNVVAYNIATGEHRSILPEKYQTVGQALIHKAASGKIYARHSGTQFRLEGWKAIEIPASELEPPAPQNVLKDGRTVEVSQHTLRVTNPKTKKTTTLDYKYGGNVLNIFRVAFGPDQKLYGSAVLPIYLLRLDEGKGITELGPYGGGEFYSFLAHGKWLLGAAYSAVSPLMKFDPTRPFQIEAEPKNPVPVRFAGSDASWRPEALIAGPDNKVFVGAVSGYGKLGGGVVMWDPERGQVEQFLQVVKDQSVISLASWKNLVVGGTTIGGGGGSHPTQTEARVFLWDPKTKQKTFETVAVPRASKVTNLVTAKNGLVYGMAGKTLFVFDPAKKAIVDRREMPFRATVYNAIAEGEDGKLWGVTGEGVFSVDPATHESKLVAKAPVKITAGFALRGKTVYFVSEADIWSWTGR